MENVNQIVLSFIVSVASRAFSIALSVLMWQTHENDFPQFRDGSSGEFNNFNPFGFEFDTDVEISELDSETHLDEYDWETERFRQ